MVKWICWEKGKYNHDDSNDGMLCSQSKQFDGPVKHKTCKCIGILHKAKQLIYYEKMLTKMLIDFIIVLFNFYNFIHNFTLVHI